MPTHPDDGNGLPPPGEEEEAAMEDEERQAAERRQQQLEDEAALAQHEQEVNRRNQEAERQRAALMRQQAEDLANLATADFSGVNLRRRRVLSETDGAGPSGPPGESKMDSAATIQQLRAALALSQDHIALQNQMRAMESRLHRAENEGMMSVAPTTVQGEERPEAPPTQRPIHGTPTTPFVEDAVDNPEEIADRATRRLIVPPLKPFTGARSSREGADEQPFSSWIKSFEQEMALSLINRTAWLKTLRYFLQDAAATVYDSRINCLPHDRRTYQGMVEVLRHTYDRCVKEREAQRALCNLHWDPKTCTIDEFYAKVEKIAASAYPQFDDGARQRLVTRQFIEAMPPTTQRQIDTRIDLSPVPQAIQSFQVLDWAREITRQEEKYSESARAYKMATSGGKGSPGAEQQAPGDFSNQQSFPRPMFGDRGRGWRGNRGTWRGAPRGGGWRGRNDSQPNNSSFGRSPLFPAANGMARRPVTPTGPGWQSSGRGGPPMRGNQLPRGGMQQQPRGGAGGRTFRDVSEINCFNCNQKGHYARACTQLPAINTKLIRSNRVGMISAVSDEENRQPPQENDGREVAESAKETQTTSAQEEKTVLKKNKKKKKKGKKRPSPPQEYTPPAPTEHEPTAGMQNESSEPTEHEPTRTSVADTVTSRRIERWQPGETPPPIKKEAARMENTSAPTEHQPTTESPTPTELQSAKRKEKTPTPTEQESAAEKNEVSPPTEHETTLKDEEKMKISPKNIISREPLQGEIGESSQGEFAVGNTVTYRSIERWQLRQRLKESIMEKRSGFRMEMFLLKRAKHGNKRNGKKETLLIPPRRPIYGESPAADTVTSRRIERWQLKEPSPPIEHEATAEVEKETAPPTERRTPMYHQENAASPPTEHEATAEVEKETAPPTERRTPMYYKENEVSPPIEHEATPEAEKEPALPTEQRTPLNENESPTPNERQKATDESAADEPQPTSTTTGEEVREREDWKDESGKKEPPLVLRYMVAPSNALYHQSTSGESIGEDELTDVDGRTVDGEVETTLSDVDGGEKDPSLVLRYTVAPSSVLYQLKAVAAKENDAEPTPRSEKTSTSRRQSIPDVNQTSAPIELRPTTRKPAADERRPAKKVHADQRKNERPAISSDVNMVHQMGSDGKRNRRLQKKNRPRRKRIDAASGERQQQATTAPMKKPYTETRLMTLPVTLNGRKASAQIDTGSPISLVGRRPILCLIARYGRDAVRKMIRPLTKPYYDYSGNEIELKGTIDCDLQLMGTRLKFTAFIDSTAYRDMILGMDILAKTGCALRLYTDRGTTDLIVSKPQTDGKSIVTLTGGGTDITDTMVLAESRYLERKKEDLDNDRKRRRTEGTPPTYQQQADVVRVIRLEPRTREFIEFQLADEPHQPPEGCESAVALVEEANDGADSEGVRIPPQLVEWKNGRVCLEVRNEDDAPRELKLERLHVRSTTDFTLSPPWLEEEGTSEWVMRVPESGCDDLSGIWQPRVSQLQSYDEPMYLDGLQYTNLDERRTDLLAALDVGVAEGDVTENNRQELIDLLMRNHDVLALTDDELGCCTLPEHAHAIDTGESPPIAQPLRRLAMTKQIEVRKTLNTMKRTGVIQASCSPWSSPIVPVWKRDGSMRITVDYRRLNEVTKKDRYPLSRCDELIDSMGLERPRFFTTLDLVQGFHQMRIADDAVEKTAFSCQEGHFEYLRMPMGLTNSPASFQRLQNEILKGTDPNKVKVYLDDVAIATNTFEDHLLQLGIVFARFRKAGLRVKVSKCKFLKEKLVYLGFEISKEGVRPNEARILDVQDFKPPTTVKMVRQFVGLCSFYRRFVPNFSKIARPLTNLTRKDEAWKWGEKEAKAFQQLKDLLTSKDILAYPQWGKPYYILCDASSQGLGAILHQKDELGRYRPIAYASRATDKYEQKYGASELECLCLVWALQHFHYYIWGQEIFVESDHQPLTCLNSKQTLPPRLERWNSIIIPYAPKIIYRRGKENEPADALSRYQKLAGTAEESAMDAVIRVIKNYPDPDVDLEQVDRNVKERQRQLQMNDPFWRRIIEAKEEQKGGRPVTRMIGKMAEKYRLLEGVLYFIGNDTEASPRLCVPQIERRVMIERYHEQRGVGGHLGAEKVYLAIAAGHFWPSMKTQVEQYCRECRVCLEQRGGAPRHKPPLAPIPAEAQPFVQVQIDVMNLPKTKKGNKKILGIVDSFTGYLIYVPMKNEEATTVARKLHKHLFTRFNAPKRMLSDNGTNFHSNVISELNKRYGVKHYFTTTFTPHSNGKTEKANSTMRQMLAKMTQDHPEDWDELVADVMWAYNTTPIPTTGFSPHFLVFGSNPAVVSDSVFDWPTLGESLEYDDYISKLERRRAEALKIADVNRSATQEQQKARYDKKSTFTSIVLGEKVMVYRPNLKTDKLKPKFDGPYEVVWLSDTVAKVRRLVDGVIETHNLDKLSRCSPTAQVTNKNQPYKPRKYQKGKKIPKQPAKDLKVKKLRWDESNDVREREHQQGFFKETPENQKVALLHALASSGKPKRTTQVAAYIGKNRFRKEYEFSRCNYGEKILMLQGKCNRQDSLRCMFCNEFTCCCEDQVQKESRSKSAIDSTEFSSRRMADEGEEMTDILDEETEKDYEQVVFEGGQGWEDAINQSQQQLPSGTRNTEAPSYVPPDEYMAEEGEIVEGPSTRTDVEMTEPPKEIHKDFWEMDTDEEDENPSACETAMELDQLLNVSDEEEEEEIDFYARVDDKLLLTWKELFEWARSEKIDYANPNELRLIRLAYDAARRNPSRNKETLRAANRRAGARARQRRDEAIAEGREDPELAKVKRNLGTAYPRKIEMKLQQMLRSTFHSKMKADLPVPQVEVLKEFESHDPVDMGLAEQVESDTVKVVADNRTQLERLVLKEGIAKAMRTVVKIAPSPRHTEIPSDVFKANGYDVVKQTKKQKRETASCFLTKSQQSEVPAEIIAEISGVGTTTVNQDEIGVTHVGFRDRPLVAATYPALLEADEHQLQREYDELFKSRQMPDDPTNAVLAKKPVENTALFYNGELAKLDVNRALELKRQKPTETLIPADVTVVQEIPSIGPLSGATTQNEALARKSPEYARRVAEQLKEMTLTDITDTMSKEKYICEEDYTAIARKQAEDSSKVKMEVIQRTRSKETPTDIALHQIHPVKVARSASAAASSERTTDRWADSDSVELKKLRAAQEENDRQTRQQYDGIRRITTERRHEIRKRTDETEMRDLLGSVPGAGVPEKLMKAIDSDADQVKWMEIKKGDESEVDEEADLKSQRTEAMNQLAAHRHMPKHRAGGLYDKVRQLTDPGQRPAESAEYRRATERLNRYDQGCDREGRRIPTADLKMLRLEQQRINREYGYRLVQIKHPLSGLPIWFEEVRKGVIADVYDDFPDTSDERRDVMTEFMLTDMAMALYNKDTDTFDNEEYRRQYFKLVSPGDFVSPLTRAVFKRNIWMPKDVLRSDPPVIANRTWQLMSQRADERCTQLPKTSTSIVTENPEEAKEWASCAYSYDQAGSIIRSHFLQDYRIEPVMRYVDRNFELKEAIQWLLRKPDLEGIVDDNNVRFLGWDLENCASTCEWKHWRPPLKKIYNVTPFIQYMCGPYPVLLTLSNCWGYTLVIDLRYARGRRRLEDEPSPMPDAVTELLDGDNSHIKFVCFDFEAENRAWYNSWGKDLPKSRFIDLQVVAERQLRLCANDVLFTIDPNGKPVPTELGLGKGIYVFTGDFDTALEKAGFFKQYNPLKRDNPSTKYLKMPEAIAGNICDLRYAAKDSIFTLFLTMRVCLVDFYTQRSYRLKYEGKGGAPPRKSAYHQFVDWVKAIGRAEPEQLHNRYLERVFTTGQELPIAVKTVMEEIGRKLANDLTLIERNRDATDSVMKIQLPYLTEIRSEKSTATDEGRPINLPRNTLDIRPVTVTEQEALTPREWLENHGIIPVPSRHEWAQMAISNGLQVAMRYVDEWMHVNDDHHKTAALQGAVHMWKEFEKRWSERYDQQAAESPMRKQLEFEHAAAALKLHMTDQVRTLAMKATVDAARILSAIPTANQVNPRFIQGLETSMRRNSRRHERQRVSKVARSKQEHFAREVAKESGQEISRRRMLSSRGSQKVKDIRKGEIKGVKDNTDELQERKHLKKERELTTTDRDVWMGVQHGEPLSATSHVKASDVQAAERERRRPRSSSGSSRNSQRSGRVTFQPASRRGMHSTGARLRKSAQKPGTDADDMDGLERTTEKRYPKTPFNTPGVTMARPRVEPPSTTKKYAPITPGQEQMWTSTSAVAGGTSYQQVESTTDADSPSKEFRPLYPPDRKKTPAMMRDGRLHQLLVFGKDGWGGLRQLMGEKGSEGAAEGSAAYSEVVKIANKIFAEFGKDQLTDGEARQAIRDRRRLEEGDVTETPEDRRAKMPPPSSSASSVTRRSVEQEQQQQHQSRPSSSGAAASSSRRRVEYAPTTEIRVENEPSFSGYILRRMSPGAPIEYDKDRRTRYEMRTDYLYHPMQALHELAWIRKGELLSLKEEAKEKAAMKKHHPEQHRRLENYIQHIRDRLQVLAQVIDYWNLASREKTAAEREEAENGFYVAHFTGVGPKLQHLMVPRMYGWEYDGQWLSMALEGGIEDLNYLLPKPKVKSKATGESTQESESDPWG